MLKKGVHFDVSLRPRGEKPTVTLTQVRLPAGNAAVLREAQKKAFGDKTPHKELRFLHPTTERWEVEVNHGDGTFDLVGDNGNTMSRVPAIDPRARHYLFPGYAVVVRYYDADRQKPYIRSWAGGARRRRTVTALGWAFHAFDYSGNRNTGGVLVPGWDISAAADIYAGWAYDGSRYVEPFDDYWLDIGYTGSGQLRVLGTRAYWLGVAPATPGSVRGEDPALIATPPTYEIEGDTEARGNWRIYAANEDEAEWAGAAAGLLPAEFSASTTMAHPDRFDLVSTAQGTRAFVSWIERPPL